MPRAILALLLFVSVVAGRCETKDSDNYDTLKEAMAFCDGSLLQGLEGIWLIPDDKVYVLLRRTSPGELPEYSMKVVAGLDGFTVPGEILGTVAQTAEKECYTASLPTRKNRDGRLQGYKKVTMRLSADGLALIMAKAPKSLRLSFSPLVLLPGFWRIVKLSFTPQVNAQLKGMVKVYPSINPGKPLWSGVRYL